jgi:uroporphyrinogen-III synthase
MTATVLITRPTRQAQVFAAELEEGFGGPVQTVISPLMEVVDLPVEGSFDDVSHVVFTSANGVAQTDRLNIPKTAIAWGVGAKTTKPAQDIGFETREAEGSNEKIVTLIVAARPVGRMVHIRGAYVAGDVTGALAQQGVICETVVAYDQKETAPSQAALDVLRGENPVIVPLFSPRTAKLFEKIGDFHAPLHLVVISEAVSVSSELVPVKSYAHGGIYGMVIGTLTRYKRFSP